MHLLLQNTQFWVLVIGALTPLISYMITRYGKNLSEPIKAAIHVIVAAVVGALYTALATHVFGANEQTLELVLTAVVGTLAAHHWLWKPSGVSTILKGESVAKVPTHPVNP